MHHSGCTPRQPTPFEMCFMRQTIAHDYSSYRHVGTAGAVRCGAVRCGRAIKTIVASGSRPAPETPLKQRRTVERTLCSEQSGHAGGWIARCDALICTTDE